MGLLDEEEKKLDEQNYVIVPKKFESATQIMNTISFLNAMKKWNLIFIIDLYQFKKLFNINLLKL